MIFDLTITGPEADRERFLVECFSQDAEAKMQLDFDKLIPQPKHLNEWPDVVQDFGFNDGPPVKLPGWYDWRCKNWGDKWNAVDTAVLREGETIKLSFSTAWSVPEPIFTEIARRFPTLKIEGPFLDGMYNFGGDVCCENGTVEYEDRTKRSARILRRL